MHIRGATVLFLTFVLVVSMAVFRSSSLAASQDVLLPENTMQATATPALTPENTMQATATSALTPEASPTSTVWPTDAAATATVVPTVTLMIPPTPTVHPNVTPTTKPTSEPQSDGNILLRVYKGSQSVVAFQMRGGVYEQIRVMICSTGISYDTPNGTFKISSKYRYKLLEGAMGQYCSRFNGGILFHSVPILESATTVEEGRSQMSISAYNSLGKKASHGCVRLLVRDAKWIYDNCGIGTTVEVVSSSGPSGSKPELTRDVPYMNAAYTRGWDPTDPFEGNPYLSNPVPTPTPVPTATPTPQPVVTPIPPTEPPAITASPTPSPTPTPTLSPTPTPEEETTEDPSAEP